MGKFLKVVVVLVFLASIGAAVLAYMNFEKRKMLTGRTDRLEKAVQQFASTLEAADPAPPDMLPEHIGRDVQAVEAREVANPDRSTFWENYKDELESDGEKLNWNKLNKSISVGELSIPQIKNYYFIDSDGKRVKTFDGYQTDGAGTMDELLNTVQDRARAQSATLRNTRAELTKVREELEDTIRALNSEKKLRRQNLVKIEELESTIRRLESEKADLQSKVTRLENLNAQLNDQYKSTLADLEKQKEDNENLKKQYNELDKRYRDLKDGLVGQRGSGGGDAVAAGQDSGKSTPGVKGTVVHANSEWAFIVVKLTPEAVAELTVTGEDGSKATRTEEYMVRRNGYESPSGNLVSRIRIQSIRRDGSNLAIAENLVDWQQTPVQAGDEVFF